MQQQSTTVPFWKKGNALATAIANYIVKTWVFTSTLVDATRMGSASVNSAA